MRSREAEKANADSWSDEIGVQGIEALPQRVQRYGDAKIRALDTAEYIGAIDGEQLVAKRVSTCRD